MTADKHLACCVEYPLSALMILLPASIIVEMFYRRVEPLNKKGGALAIMVIHAVIYVIFMIGFLIAAVFSIVGMALNDGSSDSYGGIMKIDQEQVHIQCARWCLVGFYVYYLKTTFLGDQSDFRTTQRVFAMQRRNLRHF